tara:strand:+ start:1327 stop:1539 length:213 start_codon:yes stop_codon:yes gene_type:complete
MTQDNQGKSWTEYRLLILAMMERMDKALLAQGLQIAEMQKDLTTLKVKATVLGLVAGSIPAIVALLVGRS